MNDDPSLQKEQAEGDRKRPRSSLLPPSEMNGNDTTSIMMVIDDNNNDNNNDHDNDHYQAGDNYIGGVSSIQNDIAKDIQNDNNGDSEPPSNRQRFTTDNNQDLNNNDINNNNIVGMKLEAIFHPKFENEHQNNPQIRKTMIEQVSKGEGVLEVSLKHSGSLVLWSGGKRYYSKNSTDNVHTHVAEVLLRQHFVRSWVEVKAGVEVENDNENDYEMKYMECSDYVQAHRLTLSFEVVTSVLGHHGDLPNRDFLILIAVADRTTGNFYSTTQMMQFAQRFRLPHNDAWIFSCMDSATQLFHLYDTSRETGLADDVIDTLTQAADGGHVKSLHPHGIFQGQILEGIVIRFVRIVNADDRASIADLCVQSDCILKAVPPEKVLYIPPPTTTAAITTSSSAGTDSSCGSNIPLLRTNLRELFANSNGGNSFDSALRDVVKGSNMKGDQMRNTTKFQKGKINIPNLANRLLEESQSNESKISFETRQICKLIQTLERLNLSVNYNVILEENETYDSDESKKTTSSTSRYLCIIHILHDECHQKYHVATRTLGAMALYRGFSMQLLTTSDRRNQGIGRENSIVSLTLNNKLDKVRLESNGSKSTSTCNTHNTVDDGKLMLKMKFLPYMVRTFICRNGLGILKKKGSYAFDQYAHDLLRKWNMSKVAINKWLGFFHAWGLYCESPSKKTSDGTMLPILSSKNYLHHLYHFETLYSNGHFNTNDRSSSKFHGLVVVVGINKEEMTEFAVGLSNVLGCSKTSTDMNTITEFDVARSIQSEGGGMVCSTVITEGVKNIRLLLKKYKKHISMIMIGCSKEEIEASFVQNENPDNKELKKTVGMAKAFRNCRLDLIKEVPHSVISGNGAKFDEDETLLSIVKALKETSESNAPDERPGTVVFFPSIPGCGKSTLCHDISKQSLGINSDQQLMVREGDKIKGKFWPLAFQEKMKYSSSIFIADKNAPPAAWRSIDKICSGSRGVAVSILPDSAALIDTVVDGHQYPFSLHYLALCISRILKREPNSHGGKLDAGTNDACMIVVMFYCLYRNIAVDVLLERMSKLGRANNKVIRLPFFKEIDLPEIPKDLQQTLEYAISLQTRKDLKLDSSGDNSRVMEKELRDVIATHAEFLDNLPASTEDSKNALNAQLGSIISSLGTTFQERDEKQTMVSQNISIVSLDFKRQDINSILETVMKYNPDLNSYFEERDFESSRNVEFDDDNKKLNRFIQKTHCTFAHAQRVSQNQMRSDFDHIIGLSCEVTINGILFDDEIAALDVSIPAFIEGQPPKWIPSSINEFQHITIWCKKDVKAFLSNYLPQKVNDGSARRIDLESPVLITGKFSYWS